MAHFYFFDLPYMAQNSNLSSAASSSSSSDLNTNLAIYYKFDDLYDIVGGEFDGFQGTFDEFDVCDLNTQNSTGPVVLNNDGIINKSLNFPSNNKNIGLNSTSVTAFTSTQKALFNIYQKDFTIRFWMRRFEDGTDDPFMELNDTGGPVSQWKASIAFSTNKVSWNLFNQTILSNEAVPSDSNFHRVVLSRDFTNSLLSIKIDNNTTKTVTYTGFDANNDLDYFFIGNPGYALDIDEWGLWKDRVLTEADLTADWNGGAGLTYPF